MRLNVDFSERGQLCIANTEDILQELIGGYGKCEGASQGIGDQPMEKASRLERRAK